MRISDWSSDVCSSDLRQPQGLWRRAEHFLSPGQRRRPARRRVTQLPDREGCVMGNEVYANSMEISCKAAAGKSVASFPDVCFTPPQTAATPTVVPLPYPNTGLANDPTKASTPQKKE